MPRSFVTQNNKYALKYDGENVTAALTAIKSTVMDPRYQAAISVVTQHREAVRRVLEENDVPVGLHGIHYAYGLAIASAMFSHSGPTLARVVTALKQRFVALGAIPTICDTIAEALTGFKPYY